MSSDPTSDHSGGTPKRTAQEKRAIIERLKAEGRMPTFEEFAEAVTRAIQENPDEWEPPRRQGAGKQEAVPESTTRDL
jgi:hypothetical protein